MKSFDTELAKYAAKIRLKAIERRELRERVLSYMEYHPLPKNVDSLIGIPSERFFTLSFNTFHTKIAGAAFAFFVVVGVPFVAEHSVPGDVLYPVKTQINESISAQFANSPYEKVAFETKLMERRIAEARLLAKAGKLSEEVEAEIAETVMNHANAAQESIAELKAADADEGAIAEISFGSTLAVQSLVFDSSELGAHGSSTDGIADVVRAAKANADAVKGTSTPSYERLIAGVELETTRAYELSKSVGSFATPEEGEDIKRRLADIDTKISDAKALHDADAASVGSVELLSLVLSDIQKLVSFMTDIDVRENVTLETLVPITYTKEERSEKIGLVLREAQVLFEDALIRLSFVEDVELRAKLEIGKEEGLLNLNMATTSLGLGDLDEAERLIELFTVIAADFDAITKDVVIPEGALEALEAEKAAEEATLEVEEAAEGEEVTGAEPEEVI